MVFLLQSINGEIVNAEVWGTLQILKGRPAALGDSYTVCGIDKVKEIRDFIGCKHCVPVGTIEFVRQFLERDMFPIEIPKELRKEKYLQRKYEIVNKDCMQESDGMKFIKCVDTLKQGWTAERLTAKAISELAAGVYQVSDYIELESEYRVLVYRGEIEYIGWYNGSVTIFPSIETVNEMVEEYCNLSGSAEAFTLDVAITKTGKTILIEIHPFVSCGSYGYCNYGSDRYLRMLERGIEYYKTSLRNRLVEK